MMLTHRATFFLSAALLAAPSALASDHFVNPPESIQAVMDSAADGDRIFVGPGTYFEVINFNGKQLELVGTAGAAQTIIDGSGGGTTVVRASSSEPVGTSIKGFTLTNGAGAPFPSSFGFDYYGGGIHANDGAQLTVEDCVITHNGWGTGTFAGGVYSGGQNSSGLYTHVALTRCVITDNRAWASGGATLVDGYGTMTFNHCTVANNSSDNFFGHQGGVSMANNGTIIVRNSIVYGNPGVDIGAFGPPYDVGTFADVESSCVGTSYAGANNISADPLFAETVDYTLSALSPCVDAGDPLWGLFPDAAMPDMGARWLGWSSSAANIFCTTEAAQGSVCPCGNNGGQDEGCANGTGVGAKLSYSGTTSISQADLMFSASQLIPNQQALYFQGKQALNNGAGTFFGDGLRCAGGGVIRLEVLFADAFGECQTSTDLIAKGRVQQGDTRYYQVWYRDPDASACGSGFNLSHGIELTFTP